MDPRKNIPDIIHVTQDGEKYLLRCPSLQIRSYCATQAERNQPPVIICAMSAHSVQAIDADGHSIIRPGEPVMRDFAVPLSSMPPQLAADVAAWMATLPTVAEYAQPVLDIIDPQPEVAEDGEKAEK
jgi:hypothetical protein